MSIEAQVREIVTNSTDGVDGTKIPLDSKLLDTGLDSLDIATIMLEVQETFGVEIPEGDEDQFDTLAKLIAHIESAQG